MTSPIPVSVPDPIATARQLRHCPGLRPEAGAPGLWWLGSVSLRLVRDSRSGGPLPVVVLPFSDWQQLVAEWLERTPERLLEGPTVVGTHPQGHALRLLLQLAPGLRLECRTLSVEPRYLA